MDVKDLTMVQRERLRVAMLDMTKAEQRSVRASLTVGGPLAMLLIGSPARDADEPVGRVRRSSPRSAAISAALTGRTLSEAHRAAISAGMKGKPRKPRPDLKGKPLTEAHRAAISAARKGKPLSEGHRAAVGARPGREAATQVGNND